MFVINVCRCKMKWFHNFFLKNKVPQKKKIKKKLLTELVGIHGTLIDH